MHFAGATGDSAKTSAEHIAEKEHVTKDPPLPIVIGLQCNGMTVLRGKKPSKGEAQQSGVQSPPKTAVKTEGKEVGAAAITPKRKRGRPPKPQAKNPETSLAVGHQNGDAGPGAASVVEGSERNAVGSPISVGTESSKEGPVPGHEQLQLTGNHNAPKQSNTSRAVIDINKLPNESSEKASTVQVEKYKSVKGKRGKRRTMSINTEALAQDSQVASKEDADGGAGNSETRVENSLDTMSDDQPLSRWFEGMHSPPTVDSAAAAPQRTVEQSSQANERRLEIVEFSLASANGDTVGGDGQCLPFVKCTSLWQTIESLEAFRMIPQKPHFRPLDSIKESSREGVAIGNMVNFSTVVGNTSALRSHHPRSAIEDCLEMLVELERHGFDIKLIRDRLTSLLMIKDKQEELQAKSKELNDKIEEQNVKGGKIDEEIEAIDKQIRELQERRAQVVSKKRNKASEIAALEATVNSINDGMHEARLEFDGLASAPW